jgi:hypothetical protein
MNNLHNSREASSLARVAPRAFFSATPHPSTLYVNLRTNRNDRSLFLINVTSVRKHRKQQKTNNSRHF